MGQILDFEDYVANNTEHDVAELICVRCHHRWIGVWPCNTLLKDLKCPSCDRDGTVIMTGQSMEDNYGDT